MEYTIYITSIVVLALGLIFYRRGKTLKARDRINTPEIEPLPRSDSGEDPFDGFICFLFSDGSTAAGIIGYDEVIITRRIDTKKRKRP